MDGFLWEFHCRGRKSRNLGCIPWIFPFPQNHSLVFLTFYKIEDFCFNALLCTQHKNTSTKYIPELLQDAPASQLVAKLNSLDAADGKDLVLFVFFHIPLTGSGTGKRRWQPSVSQKRATHSVSWNLLVKTHGNIPPGEKKIKKEKEGKAQFREFF